MFWVFSDICSHLISIFFFFCSQYSIIFLSILLNILYVKKDTIVWSMFTDGQLVTLSKSAFSENPSGAHGFIPGFWWSWCCSVFFFYVIFLDRCLSFCPYFIIVCSIVHITSLIVKFGAKTTLTFYCIYIDLVHEYTFTLS